MDGGACHCKLISLILKKDADKSAKRCDSVSGLTFLLCLLYWTCLLYTVVDTRCCGWKSFCTFRRTWIHSVTFYLEPAWSLCAYVGFLHQLLASLNSLLVQNVQNTWFAQLLSPGWLWSSSLVISWPWGKMSRFGGTTRIDLFNDRKIDSETMIMWSSYVKVLYLNSEWVHHQICSSVFHVKCFTDDLVMPRNRQYLWMFILIIRILIQYDFLSVNDLDV